MPRRSFLRSGGPAPSGAHWAKEDRGWYPRPSVEWQWPLWCRGRRGDLLPGVVTRADQRARLDVAIAHFHSQTLQLGKFRRRVPAGDREVLLRGSEILPQGQDIDVLGPQIAPRHQQLIPFFAQTADDARLGQ